jgi:hypothetical protein
VPPAATELAAADETAVDRREGSSRMSEFEMTSSAAHQDRMLVGQCLVIARSQTACLESRVPENRPRIIERMNFSDTQTKLGYGLENQTHETLGVLLLEPQDFPSRARQRVRL